MYTYTHQDEKVEQHHHEFDECEAAHFKSGTTATHDQ